MKATLFLWMLPLFGLCQQTAFFETTIYFEDAVGNRDSVVVGHDLDANVDYNPQFGELDIKTPYDSVFEVRAARYFDFNSFTGEMVLSKKIIGHAEGSVLPTYNCLPDVEPIALFAHAKYQPITVSWDKGQFNNSFCRAGTVLTSHILPMVTEFWAGEEGILEFTSCMAEDSVYSSYLFDYGEFGFFRLEQVEGMGQDTAFGLLITFIRQGTSFSPCTATVIVGTDETYREDVNVYPNPTTGELYFEKEITENYVMWDTYGRQVMSGKENPVDMSGLAPGLYYLKLDNVVKKVVKY
ncbi:MAG TPA: T9SS type A sorting domain-containing protein [Bacteroidetes bacterium]|nr:T9SS type A sorting domain-containing protein [Bacteroidota bacterium]